MVGLGDLGDVFVVRRGRLAGAFGVFFARGRLAGVLSGRENRHVSGNSSGVGAVTCE